MNRAVRAALLVSLLAAGASRAHAGQLDHEFRYEAGQFSLVRRGVYTEVRLPRAGREFTPGAPDFPVLSEAVEIPGDARVAAIEVLAMDTAPLASGVLFAPTAKGEPGLPIRLTEPAPEWYARAGMQPESPVTLGTQGWMRGVNLASLKVVPVRWNAQTGELVRITRIVVRLTLEGEVSPGLQREREAPSWDGDPVGDLLGRRATPAPGLWSGGAIARAGSERFEPGAPGRAGFEATQIPSILGSPVAYVIITDDAMAPEFQRLADWKTQSGVPAVVRTLSFINAQYPGGVDDADRIRLFLRDAYQRWGTSWALLGGDTEILPTRYIYTTYNGGETIACDMYYSCLDGNWNWDGDGIYGEGYQPPFAPGDSCDFYPEVWVGRAPVTTVAEAQVFVDKTLRYTQNPPGDYEHTVLFFAEVLFPQPWTGGSTNLDGAEIAEDCLPSLRTNPAIHYARLYQNYTDPRWEPGAVPETRAIVIDSLNAGYNVSTHIGHGYRNVMSCADDNLTNADALALTNSSRLTHLYASNCTSNAIDFPSIGEALIKAPNGGAVSNIGSSRFDFPTAGRFFEVEYFRLVYEDSVTAVGEAQARQKIVYLSLTDLNGVNRWTVTTLLLLGDPETRIFTGTPRLLSVIHPGSLTLSDSNLTVTVSSGGSPLTGARVVAYKAGDEYHLGTTNGAGQITLPFRADSAGSCLLTVTAFDARPYRATIPVTAGAGPALGDLPFTVDDNAIGGTIGNDDGRPDAGERVDLKVAVRNNGGAVATGVTGTIASGNPGVTVVNPGFVYGTINAGATSSVGSYRLDLDRTLPDQTEVPLTLTLKDGGARTWVEHVALVVSAPVLRHDRHTVMDAGGNSDGHVDPGETITYHVSLQNVGSGTAEIVSAVLRNHDGLATVTDSIASWGTLAPNAEAYGDNLVFVPSSVDAKLELRISDLYGLRWSKSIDLVPPIPPDFLVGAGTSRSIKLTWSKSASADLIGYNIYRATSALGPFTRANRVPTDRSAYYVDDGLPPLTQFYYYVTAVDSSGNESDPSGVGASSTNPPSHAIFPLTMGEGTIASVTVDHLYPGFPLDIVAGANVVYVVHPDGTAPVDGDGLGATHGDFSTRGRGFKSAPSIADIDNDGVKDIIAISSDSLRVYAFDLAGQVKPGWPAVIGHAVWASPAIGDLDNDQMMEIVFTSNGNKLYVFRADGTEWVDGDSNPGTLGVFKLLSNNFNFGTPALADLDGNNELDIVVADFNGNVHAWRPNGTELPGFPVDLPGQVTASIAVGYLDGPSDTQLDIVIATGDLFYTTGTDSVWVLRADGSKRPGWPRYVRLGGNNRAPSPVLADMNGDQMLDVVVASTNGKLYVFDRNGVVLPLFNGVAYSATPFAASEGSPIVADINGDGLNDILMGDEDGALAAISGTGSMLGGFPIFLDAEVKGAPAVCDCDGDGMTEIVVAGNDKNLYVWDYDFPFSPAGIPPWPQYNHDARHTGLASNTPFVAVEPAPPAAPAQVSFASPAPNPAARVAGFSWAVPADRTGQPFEVAVFDLAGRRVRMLASGPARAGRHAVAWDLRDTRGARVANGVYFAHLVIGDERFTRKIAVMQ